MHPAPRRILALQLKRIGDLILTTPALQELRHQFPTADITLIFDHTSRQIAPAITCVNHTEVFQRGSHNMGLWWRTFTKGYDVVIDFTGNDRSAFLSRLSRAPQRLTYARTRSGKRRFCYTTFVESSVRERHTVDHHLDLLQPLGIEKEACDISLSLPKEALTETNRILADHNISGAFFIVHPGTARIEKFWPPENWAAVINHTVHRLGIPCILTGTNAEIERAPLEVLKQNLTVPVTDLTGTLDLLTLTALIQRATFFLGVDSAPMHLAGAVHTPQIALFGPTNPYHWYPRSQEAHILLANHKTSSPFQSKHKPASLENISVEDVLTAISEKFCNS